MLEFEPPRPKQRLVREIAVELTNGYLGTRKSRGQLNKLSPTVVHCFAEGADGKRKTWDSLPISLRGIEEHLEKGRGFDFNSFKLTNPHCRWLDSNIEVGMRFHFTDERGESVRIQIPVPLGDSFPLVPVLDREGFQWTSFQEPLQRSVLGLRHRLVEWSDRAPSDAEWISAIRALVSDCVALVDITLHQLYFKAQYDPLPNWTFDPHALGDREGRRLGDKLRWVGQITGKPLSGPKYNAARKGFDRIREVRNHLNHFDPPCFACTTEDLAGWLNCTRDVALLLWEIRRAASASLSTPMIELLLAPAVKPVPANPNAKRSPQPSDVGYGSVRWPARPSPSPETHVVEGTLSGLLPQSRRFEILDNDGLLWTGTVSGEVGIGATADLVGEKVRVGIRRKRGERTLFECTPLARGPGEHDPTPGSATR